MYGGAKLIPKSGYESLANMIKALLSCFHGQEIESSFSAVKNIMNCKTLSMNVPMFDAKQMVRYDLDSPGKSSAEYFHRVNIAYGKHENSSLALCRENSNRKRKRSEKRETQIERRKQNSKDKSKGNNRTRLKKSTYSSFGLGTK